VSGSGNISIDHVQCVSIRRRAAGQPASELGSFSESCVCEMHELNRTLIVLVDGPGITSIYDNVEVDSSRSFSIYANFFFFNA
jgi:hypothetical protein